METKTKIEKLPKSQVKITIEVSPAELEPFFKTAAAELSQEVKIKGFRPGKAPYQRIKQELGEMKILEKALDNIISKTYRQALEENRLWTVGQPEINIVKAAPGNPLVYQAKVSLLPEVKIGDYSELKLSRKKLTVSQEEVDKVLEDLRKIRAQEKKVSRPARAGDRLEIDFEIFLDKVPLEGGQHKKYPITIGEGRFIPGFEDQLVGISAEETKEFQLKYPKDYFDKKIAGRLADFKVFCQAVFEVNRPELNDEFAKLVSGGKIDSLAGLKEEITKNLRQEKEFKQEQKLEIEMLDKIVELSEFHPLPDILINHEIDRMISELKRNLQEKGLKFEDYLGNLKKTESEIREDFRPQAEKRLKTSLICRKIYQEKNFQVAEQEVQRELEQLLKKYSDNQEVKKQLDSPSYREYLKNAIANRKVIDYLKQEVIK